jgi:hypothetical protein
VQVSSLPVDQVNNDLLRGILNGQVRHRENAQRSLALRIRLGGKAQDLLVGNVAGAGNDGQDNSSGLADVVLDHALDEVDVTHCCQAPGLVLKHAGHVNDREVDFVGATSFDAQNILAKCTPGCILITGRFDAHYLLSL